MNPDEMAQANGWPLCGWCGWGIRKPENVEMIGDVPVHTEPCLREFEEWTETDVESECGDLSNQKPNPMSARPISCTKTGGVK